MKNAFWGYWLVLLGVFIVVIMLLVQNLTTSNTQDYYLVKEITEAAMIDAVDYSYYRYYGEIRINKEKFYESFLRRFAETASLTTTYTVSFFGVYEAPPKASVEIKSKSNTFNVVGDAEQFNMVERIDAIIEGNSLNGGNSANNSGTNSSVPTTPTGNNISNNVAGNSSRIPSADRMYSMVIGPKYQEKFNDCVRGSYGQGHICTTFEIKSKYNNNPNLLAHDILTAWEQENGIDFADEERQEFINVWINSSIGKSKLLNH